MRHFNGVVARPVPLSGWHLLAQQPLGLNWFDELFGLVQERFLSIPYYLAIDTIASPVRRACAWL